MIFQLDDLQKVLYAKKLLTGLVQLFVQREHDLNTWQNLKKKHLKE